MVVESDKEINIIKVDFKDKNKTLVQILTREYERMNPIKPDTEYNSYIYSKLRCIWIKRQYYLRYGKNGGK